MATARKKARTTGQAAGSGGAASGSAAMELHVFEDNGGRYRWTLVAATGEQLARSPSFASHEDARNAASRVRNGAGSARLEGHEAPALPVDLTARREAAAREESDPERWLDEGGGYSAAVAVELPAAR